MWDNQNVGIYECLLEVLRPVPQARTYPRMQVQLRYRDMSACPFTDTRVVVRKRGSTRNKLHYPWQEEYKANPAELSHTGLRTSHRQVKAKAKKKAAKAESSQDEEDDIQMSSDDSDFEGPKPKVCSSGQVLSQHANASDNQSNAYYQRQCLSQRQSLHHLLAKMQKECLQTTC